MLLSKVTVYSGYTFFVSMCSLGIEPTTFALPLSQRNTGTKLNHHLLWASLCLKQCTRAEFLRSFAGGLLKRLETQFFWIESVSSSPDRLMMIRSYLCGNISSWHTTAKYINNWLLFINSWNIFSHITTAKQIIFVWLKGWISISQSRSYFTPHKYIYVLHKENDIYLRTIY